MFLLHQKWTQTKTWIWSFISKLKSLYGSRLDDCRSWLRIDSRWLPHLSCLFSMCLTMTKLKHLFRSQESHVIDFVYSFIVVSLSLFHWMQQRSSQSRLKRDSKWGEAVGGQNFWQENDRKQWRHDFLRDWRDRQTSNKGITFEGKAMERERLCCRAIALLNLRILSGNLQTIRRGDLQTTRRRDNWKMQSKEASFFFRKRIEQHRKNLKFSRHHLFNHHLLDSAWDAMKKRMMMSKGRGFSWETDSITFHCSRYKEYHKAFMHQLLKDESNSSNSSSISLFCYLKMLLLFWSVSRWLQSTGEMISIWVTAKNL